VSFGVIGPGVNVVRTLYLQSAGAPGDRMVDISVRTLCTAGTNTETEAGTGVVVEQERGDVSETLRTLVVPTVEAVKVAYKVVYRRKVGEAMGPGDLRVFEPDYCDDGEGGEGVVDVRFECGGPWQVAVESVRLVRKVNVWVMLRWFWFADYDSVLCLCRTEFMRRSWRIAWRTEGEICSRQVCEFVAIMGS
jgi:trafficking protein particle complex subunit 11